MTTATKLPGMSRADRAERLEKQYREMFAENAGEVLDSWFYAQHVGLKMAVELLDEGLEPF